jgi:hypothetical protein
MKLVPKNSIYMFLFCFLILFFKVEFSLAYRSDQVYSDQVYIVDIIKDTLAYNSDLKVGDIVLKINNYDITADNYTTVIREIIRQLKAFSTVNTNSSVILVPLIVKRNDNIITINLQIPKENPIIGIFLSTNKDNINKENIEKKIDSFNNPSYITDSLNNEIKQKSLDLIKNKNLFINQKINVLDAVFIDNSTHKITFVGHYDPKYNVDYIPYYQILDEALSYPYPYFSFELNEEVKDKIKQIENKLDIEFSKIYSDKDYATNFIKDIINYSTNNNKNFYVKSKETNKGIYFTQEEILEYINWDPKSKKWDFRTKEQYDSYFKLQDFFAKLFSLENIDTKYAAATLGLWRYRKVAQINPNDSYSQTFLFDVLEYLDLMDYFNQMKTEYNKGNLSHIEIANNLLIKIYSNLLSGIHIDNDTINNLINQAIANKNLRTEIIDDTELSNFLNKKLEDIQRKYLPTIIEEFLKDIKLDNDYFRKKINIPLDTKLIFKNIPQNTYISYYFFVADYTLKYITSDSFNFIFRKAEEYNYLGELDQIKSGLDRFYIEPNETKLRISKDKTFIKFEGVKIDIKSESLNPNAPNWYKNILNEYSLELTKNYENWAIKYPSFHILREIQKIITLARFLKNNNIKVAIPEYRKEDFTFSSSLPGTIRGYTLYNKKLDKISFIVTINGGGIDFSNNYNYNIDYINNNDALVYLVVSNLLAKDALKSAIDGDLENARFLAEKSAQAMVGLIDKNLLPNLPNISIEKFINKNLNQYSIGTLATMDKEVQDTINYSLSNYYFYKQVILNNNNDYDIEKVQKQIENSKKGLAKLYQLLSYYESQKIDLPTLYSKIKDFQKQEENNLYVDINELKKPLTKIDNYSQNNQLNNQLNDQQKNQQNKPDDSKNKELNKTNLINKIIPDDIEKEIIKEEIAKLYKDLEITKNNLNLLNKSMLENLKEFNEWTNKTEQAIKNSQDRFKEILKDSLTDALFDITLDYFKDIPAKKSEIERFKQLLDVEDFAISAYKDEHSWESIAECFVKAVQAWPDIEKVSAFGISNQIKNFSKYLYHLVNTGFDVYTIYIQFQKMKELERNIKIYSEAVNKMKKHIDNTNKKIKELQKLLDNINSNN